MPPPTGIVDTFKVSQSNDNAFHRLRERQREVLRSGIRDGSNVKELASELVLAAMDSADFEVLTPSELLAHRGDNAYELAIDTLSFPIGDQGKYVIDADLIVRETEVGYPVGAIWATNALADEADRIAFWAGQIQLAARLDMRVCVLTHGAASPYPPAETERREALVIAAVEKAYWMGDGHPSDVRLTRFADFEDDLCVSRNYALHK